MLKMYHTTHADKRSSISMHGLLVDMDNTGYGAIFLADTMPPSVVGIDIWVVDASGLKPELEEDFTGDPVQGRWWMYFGNIPADCIALMPERS